MSDVETVALPAGWEAVTSRTTQKVYYENVHTGETQWDFPCGDGPSVQAAKQERLSGKDSQPLEPIPDGWTSDVSRTTGIRYYVNLVTNESQVHRAVPQLRFAPC
eukprot:SAG11_NODE_2991_length_2784_cov_21.557914_1_plen_105_part_00